MKMEELKKIKIDFIKKKSKNTQNIDNYDMKIPMQATIPAAYDKFKNPMFYTPQAKQNLENTYSQQRNSQTGATLINPTFNININVN